MTACGEDNKPDKDDTAAPDWRNSIEYEGSFFVERERKLLYALDKGKIILWDNGGDGSILQTLEYDTSVEDAIDRMETEDINSDGFSDIRMLYSEKDGETEYSLWLWKDSELRFFECRAYRFVPNPETRDDGNVNSSVVLNGFGTLERVYSFNAEGGLDEESFVITDATSVANTLGSALLPDFAGVMPADGNATVDECTCPTFAITDKAGTESYLAYSNEGVWYVDTSGLGLYRTVTLENGTYKKGEYVGEAGSIRDTVSKMGENGAEAEITDVEKGYVGDTKAVKYTLLRDGTAVYVVTVDKGLWYYSENGEDYNVLDSKNCAVGSSAGITFEIPSAEESEVTTEDVSEESN